MQKINDGIHLKGKVRAIIADAKTGQIKKVLPWKDNIIPICGLAALARALGNNAFVKSTGVTNEGRATYGAVGNGNATPVASNIKLENEVARKVLGNSTLTDTSILIEYFFEASEANFLITNMALFGEDASVTEDSGTMFEYAFFDTPFTKTTQEVVTVQCVITFSQG